MAPPLIVDPDRFNLAARRFAAFFRELSQAFVEREDLLMQIALALLSREHVLMTGPPGTAKSQVAAAVLRRIVDEETGAPSVYTRQFTESTVQTDLVGPLDFKTLMETGRSAHFTDEGILGAVHAFLDEVFDGRDMLLRSALNVLHERELKEGTRTTRGAIECAIMTSNRYLAEILEGSRETLLAFVDRIAFVSFVPRGFAEPQNLSRVLRQQVGGDGSPMLTAPLSIQDLDVLQAAVDSVYVSDVACDALAKLLDMLSQEMAAASRGDPSFLPTRYLSTRTAVRAGRVLRAIAIYNKVFHAPDRPLEVLEVDFPLLRLHLLLTGLQPEQVARLAERETDPRERRQLEIIRTERDVFSRCLQKLPNIPRVEPPTSDVERLERNSTQAIKGNNLDALVSSARELAIAAHGGTANAANAARMLKDTVAALTSNALRAGIAPQLHAHRTPDAVVQQLATLAHDVEALSESMRPLARWLRGRALWLLDEAAVLAPGAAEDSRELLGTFSVAAEAVARAEKHLARLHALWVQRNALITRGADAGDGTRWHHAVAHVEEELAVLWDGVLRVAVSGALQGNSKGRPGEVLGRLVRVFEQLDAFGQRLHAVGASRGDFKVRVAGRRIWPLVSSEIHRMEPRDAAAFLAEVDTLLEELRRVGLEAAVDGADLLDAAAAALLRAPGAEPLPPDGLDLPAIRRALDAQVPLLATLIDVACRVVPLTHPGLLQPEELTTEVTRLLRQLPAERIAGVVKSELRRLEVWVGMLEAWWAGLRGAREPSVVPVAEGVTIIEAVVASGFLRVMREEAIAARLGLEARRLADFHPDAREPVDAICRRTEALEKESSRFLIGLLGAQSDAAWSRVVGQAS